MSARARRLVYSLAAAVATACASPPPTSVRTLLQAEACTAPAPALLAEFRDKELGVQECPGFAGWRVLFVSSDERSWVELRSGERRWSSEDDVVYRSPIGNFPGVDEETPLEWRTVDGDTATALIFHVTAQRREDPTNRISTFYVVRFAPDRICVVGREPTLEAATAAADGAKPCP